MANALVRITGRIMGGVRDRSGSAYAEFRGRPQHARWRFYALGSYGLIVAATLVAQMYKENKLDVYVRVQHVELPAVTQIFVRNDSQESYRNLRLTLNGIYTYEKPELRATEPMMLQVTKFTMQTGEGRTKPAPKNVVPEQLTIDCDRGHYEIDLTKR